MGDWDIIGIARIHEEAVIQTFLYAQWKNGRERAISSFEDIEQEKNAELLAKFCETVL